MRMINSKQTLIKFVWCNSPITIDKSAAWGEGNFQEAPNGAFLKLNSELSEVSHLVQPNADKTVCSLAKWLLCVGFERLEAILPNTCYQQPFFSV